MTGPVAIAAALAAAVSPAIGLEASGVATVAGAPGLGASGAATGAPAAVLAASGVIAAVLQIVGTVEAATLARAVTATVGFFVAYQAYRGYRRNDSRPMLFLGVGICFVTTISFVVSTLVVRPLGASESVAVLSWTTLNVVGLASIFYAFTGASRGRR